jgi:hypothetical protein
MSNFQYKGHKVEIKLDSRAIVHREAPEAE